MMRFPLSSSAAALLLLLSSVASAEGQEIRGRVLDAETGRGLAAVRVTVLDDAGARVAAAASDTAGGFRVAIRRSGAWTLRFEHVGYAPWQAEAIDVGTGEYVQVEVRLSPSVYVLDPLTVTSRVRRHDPTYEGLYARIPRSPRVGSNRILVKGDVEFNFGSTVRDIVSRNFLRGSRRLGACLYWNGTLQPTTLTDMWLDTPVRNLEALEVYLDPLSAPTSMRGPPLDPLATRCGAVIAMWAYRPDLPGRESPRTRL